MKVLIFVILLSSFLISLHAGQAHVRYANSLPQFGSANVRAFLPNTEMFTNVAGGSLTGYANLTAPHWYVYTASYQRNVTALSFPYLTNANSFYSLFTYQTAERRVLNKLISDTCQNSDPNTALLRTINLVQYNYPINVYNLSNNAELFDNISYADASPYLTVPTGDYVVYWTSAAVAKRGIHGSNVSGDPFLYGGKAYSYWVLPSGSFIVEDCAPPSKKRNVNPVSISKLRMRKTVNKENVAMTQEKPEEVDMKEDNNLSKEDENSVKDQQ